MSQLVIGAVAANSLWSLNGTVIRALKEFNFYAECEKFFGDGQTHTADETQVWLRTLGEPVEATPENVAEYQAMDEDARNDTTFSLEDGALPTTGALEFIAVCVPDIKDLLNHPQILTLATNLEFVTPVGAIRNLLEAFSEDTKQGSPLIGADHRQQALIEMVISANADMMQAQDNSAYERQGFVISVVQAQAEGQQNFAYSERLREKYGFEVFTCQGKADVNFLANMVGSICFLVTQGHTVTEIKEDLATMGDDATAIRYEIIEADPLAASSIGYIGTFDENTKLYQLILADTNNKLPNEEGYNVEDFAQPNFDIQKAKAAPEVVDHVKEFEKDALVDPFFDGVASPAQEEQQNDQREE